MFLSHLHKFIYINNPKTGGSSIRETLSPVLYPGPLEDHNEITAFNWGSSHDGAFSKNPIFDEHRNYKIVGTVRNPWCRVWGQYWFDRKIGLVHAQEPFAEALKRAERRVAHKNMEMPPDWMTSEVGWLCPQSRWFYGPYCRPPDILLRFENLDEDFANMCVCLGIPPMELRRENENPIKPTLPYQGCYDKASRRIVAMAFAPDIDRWGYELNPSS